MAKHHVIVGGGPAATNAVETIRQFDTESTITLVSDEPAHSRMALPYWIAGQIPREHVLTGDEDYFQRLQVQLRVPARAARLDAQSKQLVLDGGETLAFDTLLIATGSSPVGLPIPGVDLPGVQPLWTLDHTQAVLEYVEQHNLERPRVVFIGAGFIGFIVLGAMFKRGWQLAVVEREPHVLPRMLDAPAARLVQDYLASRGVEVHCGTGVQEIRQGEGTTKQVVLEDGRQLEADVVIVATGVKPNVDWLDGSGLEIDQGILIDEHCRTNVPDVYAAGDVAQGPVLFSDHKEIHAIQPTAVDHGRVAGANMAGQDVSYPGSLAMNVVDICGLQAASFGRWDAQEATTIENPSRHIYRKLCYQGDHLVGAIFLGRASDLGMLNDVGMVKGILQTQTPLGPWKQFLQENPFDIRRVFVACQVADKLCRFRLIGRPAQPRGYRYQGGEPQATAGPGHPSYVQTKAQGNGA